MSPRTLTLLLSMTVLLQYDLQAYGQTTNLPLCAQSCVGYASVIAGCASVTDVQCFCTSQTFLQDVEGCLAFCTPAEQADARSVYEQTCGLGSGNNSATVSRPNVSFATTTAGPTATVKTGVTLPSATLTRPAVAPSLSHTPALNTATQGPARKGLPLGSINAAYIPSMNSPVALTAVLTFAIIMIF